MQWKNLPLDLMEKTTFSLRALYQSCGYTQYRMGKFEEYDLYARNKDFLISDHVITFTDTDGKLMAMKPDVTLSIVKNTPDTDTAHKLYYNENVYRVTKGSRSFREIMQVGLECLGSIDDYCICEVLTLAAESLRIISCDSVLNVSHLGLLTGFLDGIGIPKERKTEAMQYIGEKNLHQLTALCREAGVEEENTERLKRLAAISGAPEQVLPQLRALVCPVIGAETVDQLERVLQPLAQGPLGQTVRLDLSSVDDIHYYNGIVCKGFVHGIPGSVLSGGQYDKLMKKMRRSNGAIGFAVYMDMLELLQEEEEAYDVDTVLLYDDTTSLTDIRAQVEALGGSVLVQRQLPAGIRCRRVLQLRNGEVEKA